MTIDIPVFVAIIVGTFMMGFGVAKGIYADSKPFRNRHLPNQPCNCSNGIGCVYVPVSKW